RYLDFTGRPTETIELVDAYTREQGMFHTAESEEPTFSETLELDLGDVVPSIAGPKRPQDRIALSDSKHSFFEMLGSQHGDAAEQLNGHDETVEETFPASDPPGDDRSDRAEEHSKPAPPDSVKTSIAKAKRSSDCVTVTDSDGLEFDLDHGRVVIAAITSCTNTSNPSVMIGAGLLARNAVERGLDVQPWVKTSLAPGSTVVTDYLERSGLDEYLNKLRFDLVGYGCTTCIGNSGPLADEISAAVNENDLVVCAVLSGNRNFEGRINQDVKANYLASPPLCVAYALAGRMDFDFETDPLGQDTDGDDVYLRDIWPGAKEISDTVAEAVRKDMFEKNYANVFEGDERWQAIKVPDEDRYTWPDSTYVRRPPFFEGMDPEPAPGAEPIASARVLAKLGDSITTDHISPAGAIKRDSPAGRWLVDQGVDARDFNSYGSRRGNHEVMMRGTFANVRLRNQLVDREGGWTRHIPSSEEMPIYDAAMKYAEEGVPLVVLAGKEYGSGSSRDWADKGTLLLGVRAVIAESFERIHRSNLIGMGVMPLQFPDGESIESLGLTGEEAFSLPALDVAAATTIDVTAERDGAEPVSFDARVRLDTANERQYFRHGGILHRVLRDLR
ncbi:MAG: aconitate hydratase AcnA, partial [Solirubrobacterales bacterium]